MAMALDSRSHLQALKLFAFTYDWKTIYGHIENKETKQANNVYNFEIIGLIFAL